SAQCRPPSPPPPASPPASKAAPRRADSRPSPSAGSPARPRNTTEKPSSPSPPRQPRPLPSSTHPPPESEDHDRFSSSSICHANFQSIALPTAQADLDVTLLREPLGENAQGDRLACAGSPGDEGEAAFANQLLDAPAERLDARRGMERLDRHVGRKRVPFEAVEREQLLVHVSSPCSSLGR